MSGPVFKSPRWQCAAGVVFGLIVIVAGQAGAQHTPTQTGIAPKPPAVDKPSQAADPTPTAPSASVTGAGLPLAEPGRQGEVITGLKQPETTPPLRAFILLAAYVGLLVLFVGVLHLLDSVQAYRLANRDSDELWKRLPDKLSADDSVKVLERLASLPQSPTGITGTTRSILAYSLIIILGIAVFHLLTVSHANKAAEYADKILTLLTGSLTTAIGFYFGTRATTEGVTAGRAQAEKPAEPSGHIEKVDPPHATHEASVTIQGTGFGKDWGNVDFGGTTVEQIENWSETSIRVKVPKGLNPGKVDVFVNPAHGTRIVGKGLFTVD